jgi:hypothetical protein
MDIFFEIEFRIDLGGRMKLQKVQKEPACLDSMRREICFNVEKTKMGGGLGL